MVQFLLETEQSYVQSLRTIIKVSISLLQLPGYPSLEMPLLRALIHLFYILSMRSLLHTSAASLSLSLSSFFLSSSSLFFSLSLFQVYLEPLKKPQAFGMIDSSLVRDIFYQIPEICSLHERFLLQISQRTERWHPLQKIGDVFVNTVSWSKTFRSSTLSISLFL